MLTATASHSLWSTAGVQCKADEELSSLVFFHADEMKTQQFTWKAQSLSSLVMLFK
jgi:hypothetical protein